MTTKTRFEKDPVLGSGSGDIMARREFLLKPLLKYLNYGIVELSVDPSRDGATDEHIRYRCSFTGEDIDGQSQQFSSSSTDGVIAIDDTVARLRRTLSRRHQQHTSIPGVSA